MVHIILPEFGGTNMGYHKIHLYSNGELEDISLNGWTFSFQAEGNYYQDWGKFFYKPYFDIKALDPLGKECSFHIISRGGTIQYDLPRDFYGECVQDFIYYIHFYSNFDDYNKADAFNKLVSYQKKQIDGYSYDSEDELEKALELTDYYNKIKSTCTNISFLKTLRTIINKSLDNGISNLKKEISKLEESKV